MGQFAQPTPASPSRITTSKPLVDVNFGPPPVFHPPPSPEIVPPAPNLANPEDLNFKNLEIHREKEPSYRSKDSERTTTTRAPGQVHAHVTLPTRKFQLE